MIKNVGQVERIVRIVIGVVLLLIGFSMDSGWKWLLLLIAIVLFGTAALSYCPISQVIGLNTIGNKLSFGKKA